MAKKQKGKRASHGFSAAREKAWGELTKETLSFLNEDITPKELEEWKKEQQQSYARQIAIESGRYKEFKRTEESKRILLVIPPQLLKVFQKMCDEESYALVEGIREAMRRMINDTRPENYESPEYQKQKMKELVLNLQEMQGTLQDPSTLSSQQKNTL